MHQSINLHDFREAFRIMDRSNNFSYDGLKVLFDGLEQYEEDTGTTASPQIDGSDRVHQRHRKVVASEKRADVLEELFGANEIVHDSGHSCLELGPRRDPHRQRIAAFATSAGVVECWSDRVMGTKITHSNTPILQYSNAYSGPLMPPSFRTRQKWIAISSAAASGIPTQCHT